MERERHARAESRYRGLKLTLTQQDSGTVVWNLHSKPRWARWSEWSFVAGDTIHQHRMLQYEREVLELLVEVLELRLSHLSGSPE